MERNQKYVRSFRAWFMMGFFTSFRQLRVQGQTHQKGMSNSESMSTRPEELKEECSKYLCP
jgi:hypothetical protein